METHKEKSVPIVKDYEIEQRRWAPVTPSNPQVPNFAAMYDIEDSEMELFLSKFSHQNKVAPQFQGYSNYIPCSSTSNNNPLWDASLGIGNIGSFDLQQRENNGNVVEMQKRGLEDYLPRLNSQGRRSKVVYQQQLPTSELQGHVGHVGHVGQSDFPYFRSWEASQSMHWKDSVGVGVGVGVVDSVEDPLNGLSSFTDLLGVKDGLRNAPLYADWDANRSAGFNGSSMFVNQNESSRFNQHMRNIFGEEVQNCGSLHQYQSVYNVNSQTNANARISNFVPATPDSRWRIDSMGSENTPLGAYNQVPTEQNEVQEQDVAAAMINLQNVIDTAPNTDSSSPDKVSMTVKNHDPEKVGEQVNDLHKTPQKKPRRRRYLPKVLSEKKPRQTPKPKTPKPTETKETVGVKRKYVRKNRVDTNTTTPPKEANEVTETGPTSVDEVGNTKLAETAAKSCRKSLTFDLNGRAAESNLPHMSNGGAFGKAQGKCDTESNQLNHTHNHGKGVEMVVEASRGGIAYDLNCAFNQELETYLSLHTKEYLNSSQPDRNISKRKDNIPHSLSGNNTEILSRSDAPHPALSLNSSPCASSSEQNNRRGSKRSKSSIGDAGSVGTISQPNHTFFGNANIAELQNFILPEICKKKRTEKVQRSQLPSTPFCDPPRGINPVASAQTHPMVDPSASKYYCCNPCPVETTAFTNKNHTNVIVESIQNRMQLVNSWADLARLKKKRSKGTTRVRDPAQLMGIASVQPKEPGPKGPCKKKLDFAEDAGTMTLAACSTANLKPKRRSKKQNSENKQLDLVLYNGSIPALTWARSTSSVEEITERMKHLDISKESCNTELKKRIKEELLKEQKNLLQQPKNALVPYRAPKQQNALVVYGREGTMVPFEGPFNPVRKRRQRAKVDLDDETTKVWNLLLENIDNKGIDGTDEEKAKWWENERSVFRGRVDSFIARMRLVQGDRRFTPWKGSVLDSVIGVFLTQNVSDHLSSSAFMSMAAHFPLKSEGSESTLSEESATALVEEPDICIYEPEESISWNEKTINQQILSSNSKIIHYVDHNEEKEVVNSKELLGRAPGSVSPKDYSPESSQKIPSSIVSNADSPTAKTKTASFLGDERAKDDAISSQHSVISSQNSTNSPNLHAAENLSTFSKSNSISQLLTTSSQSNYLDYSTSFLGLLKMAESPLHEYNRTQQATQECMNHVTKGFPEAQGTGSSNNLLNLSYRFPHSKVFETLEVDSKTPYTSLKDDLSTPAEQSNLTTESMVQHLTQEKSSDSIPRSFPEIMSLCFVLEGEEMVMHSQSVKEPTDTIASSPNLLTSSTWKNTKISLVNADVAESTTEFKRDSSGQKEVEQVSAPTNANASKTKRRQAGKGKNKTFDWDSLRREAQPNGQKNERTANTRDSLDWEAVRHADVSEIAEVIKERGMNNMLAERIKDLLDRLVEEHGSIDMEWVRDIPPDKAKEYLLSFRGLGLKSVECVRLLTLHHLAFPVDTNVGRIAVRLGWVPLQPLPESLQLHLLELYPILESIQKYLWPRLCKLDQKTLYELHYHLITFGKVFCTKRQPNCNACPLRAECRHFASAFASARFALPGPEEKSIVTSGASSSTHASSQASSNLLPLPPAFSNQYPQNNLRCVDINRVPTVEVSPSPVVLPLLQTISHLERQSETTNCEPIVEVPASPEPEPEPEQEPIIYDIEDTLYEDPNEIPTISLNMKEFSQTVQKYIQTRESNALVALTPEAASIPTPKLKNINRLRTEHHVYELPDTHPLLKGLDKREPDDPCSYLLAIWTPGETADSILPPERRCNSEDPNILCNEATCSYCNSLREANSQIVRGTLLIPCRTAMRGSFPLNGTYFQVNEVFADHDSSTSPIAVPRSWLWNLPRRTVYFGTSIPTIFRGLTTEEIQHCFWRGFVCVRGFDQRSRAPRPLMARLHFPASRMQKKGEKGRVYDE